MTCCTFSSDGRYVTSGSKDSTVLVWAVPPMAHVPMGGDTRDSTDHTFPASSPQSPLSGRGEASGAHSPLNGQTAEFEASVGSHVESNKKASKAGPNVNGLLGPVVAVLKPATELLLGKGNNWTLACSFSPSAR